jgi:hypothetical protein
MKSILFLAATLLPAAGQITKDASVLSAGGGSSAGARFQAVSVTGQPPGASTTAGALHTVVSGFLGGPILDPDRDTDEDGLADELDADNDGDTQSDEFEVLANTDHNDFASRFSLVAQPVDGAEGQVVLVYEPTFPSRLYSVEWIIDLDLGEWTPLLDGDTTIDGRQHVTKDENTGNPARKFYRIRIELAP